MGHVELEALGIRSLISFFSKQCKDEWLVQAEAALQSLGKELPCLSGSEHRGQDGPDVQAQSKGQSSDKAKKGRSGGSSDRRLADLAALQGCDQHTPASKV